MSVVRKVFFSLFFISGLLICPAAFPSTNVSGHITEDTTWDLAGSPYVLDEDLYIDSGATLTLAEGVVLRSDKAYTGHWSPSYDYDILVDGRLEATNATIELVGYDSYENRVNATDMHIRNGGELSLSGCTFTGVGGTGLYIQNGATANLFGVTFVSGIKIVYQSGSAGTVDDGSGSWSLNIASDQVAVTTDLDVDNLTLSQAITLPSGTDVSNHFNLSAPVTFDSASIGYMSVSASAAITNSTMSYMNLSGGAPTVTGSTFTDETPLRLNYPNCDTSGIIGNTFNAADPWVNVMGTVNGNRVFGSIDGVLSKYRLNEDLTVAAGATLTLAEGVTLRTDGASAPDYYSYDISVYGRLEATNASIELLGFSNYYGKPIQITDMFIHSGGELSFSGGTFKGFASIGLYIQNDATADLLGVTFVSGIMIVYQSGSAGTVDNCDGNWNLYVHNSAVTVKWCDLDKVYVNSCNPSIFGNNFFGSAHLYVTGDPASMVTAENNWWGSADPCEIENKITHNVDDGSRPLVDFEPFRSHPFGQNVIYLDFASYTPPGGYGTAEEIASYVKQSVISKFLAETVSFATSFEGSIEKPNLTSQVIFGGTHPDPNRLGSAGTDPGNNNWTDIAYVYSDQALFTSMPSDANEYKNMLSNTTAHEIGHLLGYDHSQAAGMQVSVNSFL